MSAIGAGCQVPLDGWLGIADAVVTQGVMSLVCLLNRGATSFEHAAECLHAATNIRLGKETLRKLCVESGQAMQQAISKGELVPEWTAKDCVLPAGEPVAEAVASSVTTPSTAAPAVTTPGVKPTSSARDGIAEALSRIYLGCDGVLVPLITQDMVQNNFPVFPHRESRGHWSFVLIPEGSQTLAGGRAQRHHRAAVRE
jgi:hypothetical protein